MLNEFASVASRKLGMSRAEIREVLKTIRAPCGIEPSSIETHDCGLALSDGYGFSVYDSTILASTVSSDEISCSIELEAQPDGVDVRARNAEACRPWCGARAWFEGRYLSPIPECAAAKVKRARDAFKSHYNQKRYGEARATLAPVLERCKRVLDRFELMWVRNDLAVTLHHLGEDAACLDVLDAIRPLGEEPETEVGSTEPAFAEDLKRLARATRTNLQLCRGNPAQ